MYNMIHLPFISKSLPHDLLLQVQVILRLSISARPQSQLGRLAQPHAPCRQSLFDAMSTLRRISSSTARVHLRNRYQPPIERPQEHVWVGRRSGRAGASCEPEHAMLMVPAGLASGRAWCGASGQVLRFHICSCRWCARGTESRARGADRGVASARIERRGEGGRLADLAQARNAIRHELLLEDMLHTPGRAIEVDSQVLSFDGV